MPEIRLTEKRPVTEEYAAYPELVQIWHRYDLYTEDYKTHTEEEMKQIAGTSRLKQLLVLARMNEEEYEALQKSLDGHIVQTRIKLAEDRQMIRETISLPE